jgi:hypothetical protein
MLIVAGLLLRTGGELIRRDIDQPAFMTPIIVADRSGNK